MELRIALCQCDIAWEQPARNLARLEPIVAAAEADVVLLPELFATGFTLDPAGVADGAGGAVVSMFFSSQRCFLSMSIKSCTCGRAAASLWQKI